MRGEGLGDASDGPYNAALGSSFIPGQQGCSCRVIVPEKALTELNHTGAKRMRIRYPTQPTTAKQGLESQKTKETLNKDDAAGSMMQRRGSDMQQRAV